jgi:hypothetical protein
MDRVIRGLLSLSLIALSGCSGILVRPAVDNVQTVAIVSLYMNRDFYNVKAPKAQQGGLDLARSLADAGLKKTGLADKLDLGREQQMIISHALREYNAHLADLGRWKVLPVTDLLKTPAYQKLYKANQANGFFDALAKDLKRGGWITPADMPYFSADSVAGSRHQKTTYGGQAKDPLQESRRVLGELARQLKVDAVAIVHMDMAYRFGKMGTLTVFGETKAIPSVSSRVVLVTKEGEIAVNTDQIAPGGGKRFEGPSTSLIEKGHLNLKDKDGKRVNAYNEAVSKAAQGMKTTLGTAFAKLK